MIFVEDDVQAVGQIELRVRRTSSGFLGRSTRWAPWRASAAATAIGSSLRMIKNTLERVSVLDARA